MGDSIDLNQLQKITDKLFDHIIRTRGIESVKLDSNYYWEIDQESLYDVDSQPTDLTIGSLKDNLGFLSSLLEEESLPVAYQLTELAPLLAYVGHTLAKDLAKYGG